jgi:VAD1 Analog of StAR-related lipid transfer domain
MSSTSGTASQGSDESSGHGKTKKKRVPPLLSSLERAGETLTTQVEKLGSSVTTATKAVTGKLEGSTKKTVAVVRKGFVAVTHPHHPVGKDEKIAPHDDDDDDAGNGDDNGDEDDGENGDDLNEASGAGDDIQDVASHLGPDEMLSKMNIILKKRLRGVSVAEFHELVWKKGDFYKGWLEAGGKDEIAVRDWESTEGGCRNSEWKDDTTRYVERREVHFTFTRTTHLYTGPPVAQVHQTHLSTLTERRCIVQIQVSMEGIPFANCFNVAIRWVATQRTATSPIHVEVGLFVNFVEQTILAGKIRSGTTEETTKTQQSLLKAVVEECDNFATNAGTATKECTDGNDDEDEVASVGVVTSDDQETTAVNPCVKLPKLIADLFKRHRSFPLGRKAQSLERTLQGIIDSLDVTTGLDPLAEAKIDSELTDIAEALATIQRCLKMSGLRREQAARNLFK